MYHENEVCLFLSSFTFIYYYDKEEEEEEEEEEVAVGWFVY